MTKTGQEKQLYTASSNPYADSPARYPRRAMTLCPTAGCRRLYEPCANRTGSRAENWRIESNTISGCAGHGDAIADALGREQNLVGRIETGQQSRHHRVRADLPGMRGGAGGRDSETVTRHCRASPSQATATQLTPSSNSECTVIKLTTVTEPPLWPPTAPDQ